MLRHLHGHILHQIVAPSENTEVMILWIIACQQNVHWTAWEHWTLWKKNGVRSIYHPRFLTWVTTNDRVFVPPSHVTEQSPQFDQAPTQSCTKCYEVRSIIFNQTMTFFEAFFEMTELLSYPWCGDKDGAVTSVTVVVNPM